MLSMFLALIDGAEQQNKFERIYYEHRKQMFYVAKSILQNNEQAEDAVQEAFLNIAKRIEYIHDDPQMIKAYVLTVAKNAAMYIQRQENRHRHSTIPYEAIEENTSSRETDISLTETTDELKSIIGRLPRAYQDALLMRLVFEMDYEQIASALKRPPATVRQQVSRAKKMLISLCEKEGFYAQL